MADDEEGVRLPDWRGYAIDVLDGTSVRLGMQHTLHLTPPPTCRLIEDDEEDMPSCDGR